MKNYHGNQKNKNGRFAPPVKVDESVSYVNPYNFISLNSTGCKRDDYTSDETYTGFLECSLNTKTETIIPDTSKEIETECPEFTFFNYQEKKEDNGKIFYSPVIPGSEIRGMLRSDFEVFTDSCMSSVDIEESFISRSGIPKKPGILKKDEDNHWHLYPAVRYSLHTTRGTSVAGAYLVDKNNNLKVDNLTYKTGDWVSFDEKNGPIRNRGYGVDYVGKIYPGGNLKGLLFIGELGGKKTNQTIHDSIFVYKSLNELKVEDLDLAVKKLKEIFDMYNDKAFNKNLQNKTWYAGYDFKKDELPVWYSEIDETHHTYLSLACIGKEAYHRSLNELLDVCNNHKKSYVPCIDKKSLCEACDLFGFVSDNDAKGSKIRIGDAIYEGTTNPYSQSRILKELSSPHISNPHFYSLFLTNEDLMSKKNLDWNYDVQFTKEKSSIIPSEQIGIRGRKMYWHHIPSRNNMTNQKTKRNCSIVPVKPNIEFKFNIYFDNITEKELKDLIAIINLDYDSNTSWQDRPYYDLCHKIGKAKPFGYGSVKLKVLDAKIRNIKVNKNKVSYQVDAINNVLNIKLEDINLNNTFDITSQSFQDALRMYNFNYLKANYNDCEITYPLASHYRKGSYEEAGHYWFMDNKSNKLKNPYVLMVLPQIKDGKDLNTKGLEGTIEKNGIKVKIEGLKLPRYKK